MLIRAPVSAGELLDKITILRVKIDRFDDAAKLRNVCHELDLLERIASDNFEISPELAPLVDELHEVNAELWDIEEGKREAERTQTFDDHFIHLARLVYKRNDRRAKLKKDINILLGSEVVEEKSHAGV